MKHVDREELAAAIKGVPLDEHARLKKANNARDPADAFAAWNERFLHELTSEFGPLPESFSSDDASEEDLKTYIRNMKKQFRLQLK
jgi:hypothetical protein